MMDNIQNNQNTPKTITHLGPLGQNTVYPKAYTPEILHAIPRAQQRQTIKQMPNFFGADIWHAYEISWLNHKGKPQVGILRLMVDAHSPYIVESKSLKLYLNGFNQMRLHDPAAMHEDAGASVLLAHIQHDLNTLLNTHVHLDLMKSRDFEDKTYAKKITDLKEDWYCLDYLDLDFEDECLLGEKLADPPKILDQATWVADRQIYSELLKSNCLVTGQPDWARIYIIYSGQQMDEAQLLRYLVSFRQHQEFHEHCVERIFSDLMNAANPHQLTIFAQYTRRGGIDIAPWRSNHSTVLPLNFSRHPRQ